MGIDKLIPDISKKEILSYTEISSVINYLENKYPVDTWVCNGIHSWPLIRLYLGMKLYKLAEKASVNEQNSDSKLNKAKWWVNKANSFKNRLNNFYVEKRLNRPADILFLSFPTYRIKIGKYWFNKLLDPMVSHLIEKKRVLFIELEGPLEYRKPRFNNRICLDVQVHKENYLWSKKQLGVQKHPEHLPLYEEFYEELKLLLKGINVSDLEKKQILLRLQRFNILVHYFKSILLKTKSKICFATCYYDFNALALSTACRQADIPFVDIQHGIQNKYHIAYGGWNKIPKGGYEMLPSHFWCWNKEDADVINEWATAGKGHKIIHGGNPSIEMWHYNTFESLIKSYEKKIKELNKNIERPVNILYSAQPVSPAFPGMLFQAINDSPENWSWWIRLHPRQANVAKEILKGLGNRKNVNINEATSFPLPVLLKNMDVHVTQWSSVVLEASAMGIPSVIIHENGKTIFNTLINKGEVKQALNAESLIVAIKEYPIKSHTFGKGVGFINNLDKLINSVFK